MVKVTECVPLARTKAKAISSSNEFHTMKNRYIPMGIEHGFRKSQYSKPIIYSIAEYPPVFLLAYLKTVR